MDRFRFIAFLNGALLPYHIKTDCRSCIETLIFVHCLPFLRWNGCSWSYLICSVIRHFLLVCHNLSFPKVILDSFLTSQSRFICPASSETSQIYGPISFSIKLKLLLPNLPQKPGKSANPRRVWISCPSTPILSHYNTILLFMSDNITTFLEIDFPCDYFP